MSFRSQPITVGLLVVNVIGAIASVAARQLSRGTKSENFVNAVGLLHLNRIRAQDASDAGVPRITIFRFGRAQTFAEVFERVGDRQMVTYLRLL